MSTSKVFVLKIIGPEASAAAAECSRLAALRRPRDPHGLGSDDWSSEDQHAIDAFCENLLKGRDDLPIVYYAEYLDAWSVAGSSLQWVTPRGHTGRLWSDTWNVWYHALPDRGALARRVSKVVRCKAYRSDAESRWLLNQVDEAARYAAQFNRPALVVALIRTIGPSRGDDEYRRCLITLRSQ
jgi:hypothetical protein